MSEIKRINDQLRRAYEGEAWHGPSLRELLSGVTAETAAAKPLPNAHSIWELVLHIAAWENVARRRIMGEEMVEITDQENFPTIQDQSETAWQQTLQTLERSHLALREAIAKLDDAQLKEKVPGQNYPIYGLLHGVIQHDLYHAGQIALLKKAQ
jgi:uncharacterized damage-inducible protein DinB